jgi:hypothetical protein
MCTIRFLDGSIKHTQIEMPYILRGNWSPVKVYSVIITIQNIVYMHIFLSKRCGTGSSPFFGGGVCEVG